MTSSIETAGSVLTLLLLVGAGALACNRGKADHGRAAADSTPAPAPVLREDVAVQVGDTTERWRLEWRAAPREACGPEDPDATTCPCAGFSYGEQGALDLVRRRPGRADERLALGPLFGYGENPASQASAADSVAAVLQRWPTLPSDFNETDSAALGRRVRTRPLVRAITLGDYDHDGRATEFVLQIGTSPCGKRDAVVVGVSRARPSLHAFTSVAHPERPLILQASTWDALRRSKGTTSAVEWPCGDHGAETQTEVRVSVTTAGIDGTRSVSECRPNGSAGRLVSSERL